MIEFEWDESKNISNFYKHNIGFDDAKNIFDDSNRIETEDIRKDYGEKRFITTGKVFNTIFVVVYTVRENRIRLISARRADRNERNDYNSQHKSNLNGK